jgi:hypothetical protein
MLREVEGRGGEGGGGRTFFQWDWEVAQIEGVLFGDAAYQAEDIRAAIDGLPGLPPGCRRRIHSSSRMGGGCRQAAAALAAGNDSDQPVEVQALAGGEGAVHGPIGGAGVGEGHQGGGVLWTKPQGSCEVGTAESVQASPQCRCEDLGKIDVVLGAV